MSEIPLRVLVIDAEYLVALDAEQILVEAMGCKVTIATPRMTRAMIEDHSFDVVLLDTGYTEAALTARLKDVENAGCALVFSTVRSTFRTEVPGFPQVPVVSRPFQEKQLVAAIRNAINPFADIKKPVV
jgi:DNA-binding response OmpR family regulator